MGISFSICVEDKLAIRWALDALTARQRVIIERYYWQGQKDQEIADALGVNQSSVYRERKAGEKKIAAICIKTPARCA